MTWWNRFTRWLLPLDPEPGIGYGPFKLDPSHPFYRAALVHDAAYTDIQNGTSHYTLEEVDRIFRRNCDRVLFSITDPGDRERYRREAILFYEVVRAWGRLFRGDLAEYKPPRETPGGD